MGHTPPLLRKQRDFRGVCKPNNTANQSNTEREKELLGVNHLCQVYNPDRRGSFSGGVNHCNSIDFSKVALSGDMTLFVLLPKAQQ